jgi:hypothetical protein
MDIPFFSSPIARAPATRVVITINCLCKWPAPPADCEEEAKD